MDSQVTKPSLESLIVTIIICCKKVRAPFLTVNVIEFPTCRFRSGKKVLSIVNVIHTFFFFYPFLIQWHIFSCIIIKVGQKGLLSQALQNFLFFKKETYNVLTNITITPLRKVGTPAHYYLLRYNVHSLNFFLVRKKM